MVQILHWKEYTESKLKERLIRQFSMTTEGAESMIIVATKHPAKIIRGELTGATIKYEMDAGKMRWYLLQ